MKKLLLLLTFVIGGLTSIQAQDYLDIIRYTDGTENYQLLVGEDGFSDCIDSALTETAHLRLNSNSSTEVGIQIVNADGTTIEIATIPATSGLSTLFLILNGVEGGFSKVNSSGFSTANATIVGTTITF